MSYEGTEEFICQKGHYFTLDASYLSYAHQGPIACPHCKSAPAWQHSIDQTNGFYPDDPATFAAPKKEVGFEDIWNTDHYNNRYAIKLHHWKPIGKEWCRCE